MVEGLNMSLWKIADHFLDWKTQSYHLGLWAWGYETRSRELVDNYRPRAVGRWCRLEFEEGRRVFGGPEARAGEPLGDLVSGSPIRGAHDGKFLSWWRDALGETVAANDGNPVDVLVDYSSMPRTFYGQVLVEACRNPGLIRSCTFAYTPGRHAQGYNGSSEIRGLRSVIGTEGANINDTQPGLVLGLGFDGILAESLIELYQIDHFSGVYADPGTTTDAVARALRDNKRILDRAEIVETAPFWSVNTALSAFLDICRWYLDRRSVMLVPLGPKPHVLSAILASLTDHRIALRHVLTRSEMIEVEPAGAPIATRIEF
jgi:hypothetical protein